ncbi:putative PLAC8 motif-containing protein [Helianthus annuus]|uniref:PLAC8 motif-containing protein n=1 Tax=Helianthus annuus TaxID=4232 RepID=A0A251T0C3_HELAN|nr:protein PLANT CADMIUM RESISTANCE 2 [Helianthus annuus]KAF5777244.1 putative PLAC8 motif-containing protein [Helianthus annuus]KAJ0488816.1 putative PLAC8 motif-containing protein [Helianthus annuus]KAJ0492404.1 putative PLAC8 motif-containing protein [Helianthus annuus]KAJ0504660.1 putative PLAC8 motif-containing protein [Helianthus annuus]KAJ0674389.1 putative PLAC8 motif-containing protein [Helianthus annuus]
MSSSAPQDNKDKAPQPTNDAQPAPAAQSSNTSAASESNSGKGETGQTNQQVVGVPPQQGMMPTWSTGLFECFDDIPTLLITFFAPCVTFGQVAEMVDRGQNSCGLYAMLHAGILYFTGCGCLLSAYYRIKMSQLYNLPNDPLINILVHLICEPCALCQEYRELQARGFNMQLGVGWRNQTPEIQQTGGIMVAPKVPGGMSR